MFTLVKPRPGQHKHWHVRIRLPGQTPFERSTGCKRKSDARHVADRLHADAAAAASAVTLAEAIGLLLGLRVRQKRSKATIGKLEEKAAQLLRFFGQTCNVLALRLADTTRYVEHRRTQRVSDSTIAMEMGVLRAALRYLRRLERYHRDPEALWPDELKHGSGVRDRWLPWTEYLQVLAAMAPEFRDHLTVYCATGVRFSELYGLRADDLLSDAELRVRGTKTDGAKRTTTISPDALEVLQRRALASPSGPLFHVTRGSLESQKTAWARALNAACRAARVRPASTNDLRRTFASWAFQATPRPVVEALVIKWLGHTSSAMVRRVYAQASSEQHQREGAKLPSRKAKSPTQKIVDEKS